MVAGERFHPQIRIAPPLARLKPLSLRNLPMHQRTHLDNLEAEAIYILRETVAEFKSPVLMYSVGKDSSVLLHLAQKAFFPGSPPFPMLHIDTGWKFREMLAFRDQAAHSARMKLIVHKNVEGANVTPFNHSPGDYTRIMKTDALKQALRIHGFDAAIGGARRDEEKSRAKERVFSFRNAQQAWQPKSQRPELWSLCNAEKTKGESFRVFPLSNWAESDVWQYIALNNVSIVSLYAAAPRLTVEREGSLFVLDDDRFPLEDGETPAYRTVRFRTLGCYPLTAAIPSDAKSLDDILVETLAATNSERSGRVIDADTPSSMEKKKREGYF